MENLNSLTLITGMYLLFNGARVLSYLPQIIAISKEHNKVTAISLTTWIFWALANLTTGIYSQVEVHDFMLTLINYGNALCCFIVVGMVMYKRKKYLYSADALIEIQSKTLSSQFAHGIEPKLDENKEEVKIESNEEKEIKI